MESASRALRQNGHASNSYSSSGRAGRLPAPATAIPVPTREALAANEVATSTARRIPKLISGRLARRGAVENPAQGAAVRLDAAGARGGVGGAGDFRSARGGGGARAGMREDHEPALPAPPRAL